MRLAGLVITLLALAFGVADAQAPVWAPSALIRTCAPAADPKVVFPFSDPQTRSGRGAILWLGGIPHCGGSSRSGTTLDIASLHSDDALSVARAWWRGTDVIGPLEAATTTHGQIIATLGSGSAGAAFGETPAGLSLERLTLLGGSASLVATADGYIGDADVVSVASSNGHQQLVLREQRHYATSFGGAVSFAIASAPITALTVGMDFRADSIIVWSQAGTVYSRWISNRGRVGALQTLGPGGDAPQLAAVLSDNNHAFVMWTQEPPAGTAGTATIYLEHSGGNVTFGAAKALTTFSEPAQQRLTPGTVALLRMSPSEGVLAAWTSIGAAGNYLVSAAGVTSRGALPAGTIAVQGTDLRLAAIAAGPHDDAVAVLESAPRAAHGFDATHQTILAARTVPGGPGGVAFEAPTQLAPPGTNGAPSVAIDPATDRAVVAWQTNANGLPSVAYSVRAAP